MTILELPCRDSWRAKDKNGYHRLNKKVYGYDNEHRWLYATYHEIDLTNDVRVIRHLCNNSWCVEMTHLKLGTYKENSQDAIKAGTAKNPSFKGSINPRAKLTDTEVIEIRDSWSGGCSKKEIAKMYNIHNSTVSSIINYRTWRHLP